MENPMAETQKKSESTRRGLLVVIMLAILVASTAAAWLLQKRSADKILAEEKNIRERTLAGEKIIQEVLANGAEYYWGGQPQTDWYLIYSEDNTVIGWKASARTKTDDENFIGVDVEIVLQRHSSHEIWTLNKDFTVGNYHADLRLANGKVTSTDISLNGGIVKVTQYLGNLGRIITSSPAPENYIPEGMIPLIMRQVAETQTDAIFEVVFNERLNRNNTVEFGTVRFRYAGLRRTQDGKTIRPVESLETGHGDKVVATSELDDAGKILLEQGKKSRTQAVDEETVREKFPEALPYLQKILNQAFGAKKIDAA